jgi:3',5'-cyclic-AMP phosphodiesterase
MHLFADENQNLQGMPTVKSLRAVVERLHAMRSELDLLLLTGDLSGDGKAESYETLQNLLLPLSIPIYWLPGNHDSTTMMEEVFNVRLISRRKCFERGGWNFVLLNSTLENYKYGHLSDDSLDWLDSKLRIIADKPTVVSLHHHPFPVNSDWLDSTSLQNSEELFAVLDKHPQVKLVLFGHIHQEFQHQRHNVDYLGSPSTCIQFQPQSKTFTLDQKSPGFRILKLYPDASWETWVERVDGER